MMLMESRYEYTDMGTWTLPWLGWTGSGRGAFISHNDKVNYTFYDGHVKSINPYATLGKLDWKPGDTPTDDFLWEMVDRSRLQRSARLAGYLQDHSRIQVEQARKKVAQRA